jgi:hypothetical protein
MKEILAYNVKTRQKTAIKNPQMVTMKNNRKATNGVAAEDGKTKLYRMISEDEARSFQEGK